jgi:DNA-binding GntR family transcriptional regulator
MSIRRRAEPSAETPPKTGAAVPRYAQLADALIDDIGNGRYQPGDLLPAEGQIARDYGVSRHTAREAIRRLVDAGLVARSRGIGTWVTEQRPQSRFVASFSSISDLFRYSKETRVKLVTERWVTADRRLSKLLQCGIGTRWLLLETCRYPLGSGNPISHSRNYLHESFGDILELVRGRHGPSVLELIELHYGERLIALRQETEAVAMPADSAELLGVAALSPALSIFRGFLTEGERLVVASVNFYPARRFKLTTRWQRERDRTAPAEDELIAAEL